MKKITILLVAALILVTTAFGIPTVDKSEAISNNLKSFFNIIMSLSFL
ncbi:MAG: hypothetical protein J7L03_03490 [Caldisericaceae bacterium]|nr:hypothetical protein [Caldisericaceae bacterium]